MNIVRTIFIIILIQLTSVQDTTASEEVIKSTHFGFMHPDGVDLAGYTVEKKISSNVYSYYTFGFPSLAATGLTYYNEYKGNGLTSTLGVGIGSVLYGSIAHQIRIDSIQYLKIGAGLTASVAYSGAYPVLSYESRF